ncbi:receptor-type tyrosine-protein phosphatase H-like isoform X2 [Polypterus senegalus]|uniref:receptor-type tyrosine-protein phosphatase H-like isoform X2 n=1 Tax=Polypterus senegalus TaxID=55291 RepID=UPI001966878D|nr:receptor-type tyrosine-protein phosphatase H-like isoform X2 [Polypterus senegalus]
MNSILGALLLMKCLVVSANSSTLSPGTITTTSTGNTTNGTITTTSTGSTTTGTITTTSTGSTTTASTPTTSTTKIVPEIKNLTVLALSTSELNVSWSSNPQNCTFSVMYNLTNITSAIPPILLENLIAGHIYNVSVSAEYDGQMSAVVSQANQTYMDCKKYKWRVNTSEISVNITEPFLYVEAKHDNETYLYNHSGKEIHFPNLSSGCEYNISIISEFGFTLCTTTVFLDPLPVTDLKTINRTKDQITMSWTPPSDRCTTSYKYRVSVPTKDNYTVPDTLLPITGLQPGSAYNICVQSVTSGNTSSSNFCLTVYTDPSNPIFTTKNVTTTSIELHWDAPKDTNTQQYNYSVKWSSENQTSNENITKNLSLNISSLRPGNLYNIIIQSMIADVSSEGLTLKILTEPLPPIAIAVKQNGTTTNVTWGKPTGSNISGFFLKYTNRTQELSEAQNFCQLTNLTYGTKYNVSMWSFVTVDELLENSSVQGVEFVVDPAMISQIICPSNFGETSIYLSWSVPEGEWDKIEMNVSSGKQYTVPKISCTKECAQEIDGLLPATSYKFFLSTMSYGVKSAPMKIECWTSIIGVATGTTVALLILILLIIIVIFILRRCREPPKPSGFPIKHSDSMKNKPITISNFPSHFYCKHRDTDFGFSEDYQSLRSVGTNQSTNAALLPGNKIKNRFTNVLPYDCSRVKLQKGQENPCSDYINANFMPGYNSSKEFIAAQGPLPNTVANFWQMIWEQNVQAVVMVTNCEEGNRVKCEQYWPKDCKPCVYEDISVTTVSDTEMKEWTLREFNVKHVKTLESRIVKHFHFTTWPDHGVPVKTHSLIAFRELVRSFMNQLTRNAPVVVHCSAGVGRTGTFIALDYLLLQLSNEMAVSVYSCVQRMRKNRPLMVQTESQYIFLHQCLLETINAREANSELIYENSDCIYANELALKEVNNFNSFPS